MRISLFIPLLLIYLKFNAQIAYTFNAVGGTYAANVTPTVVHASGVDDAVSAGITIGFPFQFGCVNYTQFFVSSNGWLSLSSNAAGSMNTNDLTNSGNRPVIAPLWDDLATGSGGNVNYRVTGTTPNRVLTVEWNQMEWSYIATTWAISFQAKLYETSNRIEFVYQRNGNATANINSASASIGISGPTAGDYYSLNDVSGGPVASKIVETTNLNSKPANGQIYRWDPTNCTSPPTAGNAVASPSSACNNYTTNLSLTGNGSGCGMTYQWQIATALAGPYTNILGANANTFSASITATRYFRCVLTCSGFSTASTPATASLIATGACPLCNVQSIASLPFSLTGQTTCGQGDDVTSSNVTNICGSSLYFGGEDVVYSFTPTASGNININVTSTGSYMGIMLYNGCPTSGGTCAGSAQSSAGNQSLCVNVTAGTTYYLVIDSWPSPTCNPFNVSISAPAACSGVITTGTAVASPTSACGTLVTNLNLSGISACGATFQWQSSAALAGPYSNIPTATNTAYTATVTSSTFFRALITCGSSTAASTVVQTSVSPTPTVPCSLSTYTAAPITYSFETFVGTTLPTTDDVLFNTIVMLGFQFCYGGTANWGGYVASNSSFVFDGVPCFPNIQTTTFAAGGVATGWSITNPAPVNGTSIPRNAVLGPWHDIDPSLGGTIRYYTTGVAPNRKFVVSFENIPMFGTPCDANSALNFTGQIKLYETTNAIEIHIGNKRFCSSHNNGEAVLGLHSFDGTIYRPPVNATAHNAVGGVGPYNQWNMTNTAYRFQSPCAVNNGLCAVLPVEFLSFNGENINEVNLLRWKISESYKAKSFQIERSVDNVDFEIIASVNGNNSTSNFSYQDAAFKNGIINYYRVIAFDEKNYPSQTNSIPIGNSFDDLTLQAVYPNPANATLYLQLSSKVSEEIMVNIKDMFGRIIYNKPHTINQGISQVSISTDQLSSGVYVLEVVNNKNQKTAAQKINVLK